MYIYELDAHGHTAPAEDRRISLSSLDSDENSFATAAESRTNSGLGVANSGITRPMTTSQLTPATALSSNWPGGILRRIDIRVESKELPEPRGDAVARPQSRPFPRGIPGERRRTSEGEDEAWGEMAAFLRNVTPPPTNFMSVPSEPYSPTTVSSRSSIRRRNIKKKKGTLRRCLSFLRGASRQKKVLRKPSVKPSVRPASPPITRSPARKYKKRPPRIKLPDSAISGRTVDGHRHIAISIPIEHAHLGPEPRLRFPRAERRTKSMPVVELNPAFYSDVNIRPMTAFVNEPHIGTQLGPVAEERESLSSRSWERSSQGGLDEARKVRLASRHTFGTVQEELSRPNTSSMSPPKTPRRISDESWSPRTSDETRESMHRQALAALQRPKTAPRPISGQSGYSFRSFASASPASKVSYPMRKSSLHPQGPENRRSRARSDSDQRAQHEHSRDSSRDQYTLQESIFSEPSFLESYGTVASGSEVELGVIKEARRAKRFSGSAEIVDTPPRTSLEAGEASGRENARAAAAKEKKRSSGQESKRSSGHSKRSSKRSSKGSSKRSSLPIEEEDEYEAFAKARNSTATLLFNPEVKKVDESITTQPRPRIKSVEIVVETPTDATFPREEVKSKDKESSAAREQSSEGLEQESTGKGKEKEQVLQESPMPEFPAEKDPKGKGKEKAVSPALEAAKEDDPKSDAKTQKEETAQSPLPSPKQRKERKKSTILTRSQRIAELKRALDMPGSEPKDLVWRRLSVSSDGSSNSTEKEVKSDPKDIYVHVPVVPENNPYSLKTTTGRFGLSAVMTVADVKPSSPLMASPVLGIEKKNSLPLSISSPGTVATVVMTSPVPPFHGLGSVTPPDSPPRSRSSSSPISSLETQTQATALKHPPLKRLGSLRRRPSIPGRQSPALSGRVSPSMQESTPRPKTAGKGRLASRKDFDGGRLSPASPEQGEASTSVLKMSRSEIFDRYEALREKQTRDMEKRLERLERNGEYWLTSMLPLLKDMSQTLGHLAMNKGKEDDRQAEGPSVKTARRPETSYHTDGRQSRFGGRYDDEEAGPSTRRRYIPGDDSFESDEEIMRHPFVPTDRSRANTGVSERSRRLYLLDDHPDLGHRVDDYERAADGRRTRSHSRHRRSQTADVQKPPQARTLSGTTTMIDSSGARTSSMGTVSRAPAASNDHPPVPQRLQGEVDVELERIKRMERLNERIDSHIHGLSLELGRRRRGVSPPSSSRFSGALARHESRSEVSLATYAAPDESGGRAYYSGMHTVEPIMRELQFAGSRLSLESSGSVGFDGDSEVRRLREGPRAVIGFGAFGGYGL
ncbi:hypothetical protein J7T55_011850 [Diaporthe amygdali]|uniref:uncharacterized protein n=1 Tax=Phomopsis amygdali TaxID=1214568 RepID=UPI0022FE390D|nr:uncharacterized protein J7T55_011850 [Diaporthe amygdali]KAJ0123385.1 hypothetical protein J7T55_011850 [Diaporthe amygdali]